MLSSPARVLTRNESEGLRTASMRSPTLAPSFEESTHLVLCDFGRQGLAYAETEPLTTERKVIENMLHGQYDKPAQVVAFSFSKGWSRDVSEDIAHEVLELARTEERSIPKGTRHFIETITDEEVEPELCT